MKKTYIIIILLGLLSCIVFFIFHYTVKKRQEQIVGQFLAYEAAFNKSNKTITAKNDALLQVIPESRQNQAKNLMGIVKAFDQEMESLKENIREQKADASSYSSAVLEQKIKICGDRMLEYIEDLDERNLIRKNSEFTSADIDVLNQLLNHAPMAGTLTILTKIQNDCKTLESRILKSLGN